MFDEFAGGSISYLCSLPHLIVLSLLYPHPEHILPLVFLLSAVFTFTFGNITKQPLILCPSPAPSIYIITVLASSSNTSQLAISITSVSTGLVLTLIPAVFPFVIHQIRRVFVSCIRHSAALGLAFLLAFRAFRLLAADASTHSLGVIQPLVIVYLFCMVLSSVMYANHFQGKFVVPTLLSIIFSLIVGLLLHSQKQNVVPIFPERAYHIIPEFSQVLEFLHNNALQLVGPVLLCTSFFLMEALCAVEVLANSPSDATIPSLIILGLSSVVTGIFGLGMPAILLESSTAKAANAKTPVAANVASAWFVLSAAILWISKMMGILQVSQLTLSLPRAASAPALTVAALLHLRCLGEPKWVKPQRSIPALICMMVAPLSNSLADGVLLAFLIYLALYLITLPYPEVFDSV